MKQTGEIYTPLAEIESRLRNIIPAKLYADLWINPSSKNLTKVLNHLRTLHRILHYYLPRQVITTLPHPGTLSYEWAEGTLMFTDLAGYTSLFDKNAKYGKEGAFAILNVLNKYFAEMLQIISKAGGNLLEFTGDAMLVQFPTDKRQNDTTRAINAGLRMQRAMENYKNIEIMDAEFAFGMRIGIHIGRFLVADIGTPWRMAHVLLGAPVLSAKQAESKGEVGRVCLTQEAKKRVKDKFRFEPQRDDHSLVVDDLSEEELGDYDIMPSRTRSRSVLLLDASKEGLINAITDSVEKIEPLICFIPSSVLKLSVENVSSRSIPPDFQEATVIFANLLGYPDDLEGVVPEDLTEIVAGFSHVISLLNAELEARGGVMQRVTFHHPGPDILGIFGVPDARSNDTLNAAQAAYVIREIVKAVPEIRIGEMKHKLYCHIGISRGQVFAAEVGEREGRREFTVMGNAANMAARLMNRAKENEILVTENVYQEIKDQYETKQYEKVMIKGRANPVPLFALESEKE